MFSFLRRKKPAAIIPLDRRGPFHAVWGNKRGNLPTPGMDAYAYETLGLAPTSPINGAVAVRMQIRAEQPQQPYVTLAVPVQGVPLVAGQVYGQPLYDPDAGFTDPHTGLNNVPYSKPVPGASPPIGHIF